jgi:PAS domain S-box-containing protein
VPHLSSERALECGHFFRLFGIVKPQADWNVRALKKIQDAQFWGLRQIKYLFTGCVLAKNYTFVVKSDLIARPLEWVEAGAVAPAALAVVEQLFDHIPDAAFYIKDRASRYVVVNQSLVERCGMRSKEDLLGRQVREIFPQGLADGYAAQDESVLDTGRSLIDHLELHWYAQRRPGWCLTTKLPLHDPRGKVIGVMGISRDLRAPGDRELIPASLAGTLEYLETHYGESLSPSALARRAGLSSIRFARLIKRIFRLTPNQLILQTRLTAAAEQLAETGLSIAEIAYACGFYDHSALTRAFRSATKSTPRQFRQMRRQLRP